MHGPVASKEKSAYVAAKHAVVGLTKTVALETARSGITCNAICPGWVLTRWCSSRSISASPRGRPGAGQRPAAGGKQPSGEFVTPQQLGEMALFLCSDAAARCARRRMEHGWRLGGAVSRWRREDQNIARKRFTVRERSKRRQAMAISVFSGAPLSG